MSTPKVLVTIPNRGWIRRELFQTLLDICSDARIVTHVHLPAMVPLENSQHHIVKKFLEEKYDYWLSFDDDTIPWFSPVDLILLDKDIIGCPYPIFTSTNTKGLSHLHWAVYKFLPDEDSHEQWKNREGLQQVDAVGGGAMIVARRVFEDERMQHGAFLRELNDDGTVKRGNDLSFCRRARDCGFEIWAHFDFPCAHVKEIDLAEVIRMCNVIASNPHAAVRHQEGSAEAPAPEAEPAVAEVVG